MLFTRDLRVHDNPALATACEVAEHVVPLFVHDPTLPSSPNRDQFLAQSLADLRGQLRERHGDLVVRSGDPVAETLRLARAVRADGVAIAADVSRAAAGRLTRLTRECARERIALREFPGLTVVPPLALQPSGRGSYYQVFTPYWRAWQAARWRPVTPAPPWVRLPPGLVVGAPASQPRRGGSSPDVVPGGERVARQRLADWVPAVDGYPDGHDDLPGDATSRLSMYLRFGCLSPRELAAAVPSAEAFLRQLCWRDFYYQLLAGFPELPRKPLRDGPQVWREEPGQLERWRTGDTGVPIVDAGMRQLASEGFMHNRARLITAAFLTKHLGLDWRAGARIYADWLLDADVANNFGNWQWVAGTGTDTRPYRGFNPIRQAHRFDPTGEYVRRYVPELAGVPGEAVHQPWLLPDVSYPPPMPGLAPAKWLPPP